MTTLVYSMLCSLDGYVEDADGRFAWAEPDDELHAYITGVEREVGCHLFGRRMYETVRYWQDPGDLGGNAVREECAEVWRAADKVVYSTTLAEPVTPRTRLERSFEPDGVRELVSAYDRVSVSGPGLAAEALGHGLVDELQVYVLPVAVGGGKPFLPLGVRLDLELLDERRFTGGAVSLTYRVRRSS